MQSAQRDASLEAVEQPKVFSRIRRKKSRDKFVRAMIHREKRPGRQGCGL